MHEVPGRPPHLPDALVGLAPFLRKRLEEQQLQRPRIAVEREAGPYGLPHDVSQLAVDVELQLLVRGVADAHGS